MNNEERALAWWGRRNSFLEEVEAKKLAIDACEELALTALAGDHTVDEVWLGFSACSLSPILLCVGYGQCFYCSKTIYDPVRVIKLNRTEE